MKFKQKPDITTSDSNKDKEKLAQDFLLKADNPASFQYENSLNHTDSWKDVFVQKDVTVFSFRIPKKDLQQLKYISKQTGVSVNALCLLSIQANNRKILKELEGDE